MRRWSEIRKDHIEEHVYLSTGCLHGEHGYCQATVGSVGRKVPATCKFCGAPCICGCHDATRAAEGVGERRSGRAPSEPAETDVRTALKEAMDRRA